MAVCLPTPIPDKSASGRGIRARARSDQYARPTVQSHFRVEVRNADDSAVISVSGELDLASSPALEEELERVAKSDAQVVVVDLRNLEFMDSTGLSVLVRAHQRAEENGRRLGLVNGSQQVQRLLTLTGVADRLMLTDVPEELLGGS
jgi:anti-sigma B factor antagonist